MKSLYIIAFLALSLNSYAQENKKVSETPIQEAENYKASKEFEAKMMKEAQDKAAQKTSTKTLASEQGLEVKKQEQKTQTTSSNSGKTLPNTASLEEIKASIPGRKVQTSTISKSTNNQTQGLVSRPGLTIQDIKKTIPKN